MLSQFVHFKQLSDFCFSYLFDFQIWDSYTVKAQTFKTAIEAASMLLRIDDIVSGIKKKQAPGANQGPQKPKIEQEDEADNEQMIPE